MTPNFTLTHEPAPRDFFARLRRSRVRSLRQAKAPHHYGRRVLVLVATVALPAFAAPAEWGFEIADAGHAEQAMAPMPFERPGDSFPGAAFYYLANDPAPMPLEHGVHGEAAPSSTQIDPLIGPAARPLRIEPSGVDRTRAQECLTAAIYYEAASEPDAGQRAVAQVVLNRVAHPSYPKTICGVVYQGSEKNTGCQFSFTCDGSLARAPNRMFWLRAQDVAREALAGYVYEPIGLAMYYHTVAVHPNWAGKLTYIGTIGAHRFYRFGGPAGAPDTFRFAYLGGEPLPQPNPHGITRAVVEPPAADPVSIQRAYESGLRAAQANAYLSGATAGPASARAAPPPVYSAQLQSRDDDALYRADRLPGSTNLRPEYQRSGSWIAQPE